MIPARLWFGFHRRTTLRKSVQDRTWSFLGHVEVWGCTNNARRWFFLDPTARGTDLLLPETADEVDAIFSAKLTACVSVLRYDPGPDTIRIPLHPTMTCVSQAAHLAGLRAYTPGHLRRILIRKGAKEIVNAGSEGRPGGESDP